VTRAEVKQHIRDGTWCYLPGDGLVCPVALLPAAPQAGGPFLVAHSPRGRVRRLPAYQWEGLRLADACELLLAGVAQ